MLRAASRDRNDRKVTLAVLRPAKTIVKRQVVIVQINGKVRSKLEVDAGVDESAVETLAKQDHTVTKYLMGKQLRRVFHVNKVQSRLVNFLTE